MNHSLFILLFTVVHVIAVHGDECEQVDGKTLLQGCELLKGLVIKSQGGTLVNDSNCDVLLPKLIFANEPRVYFDKADPKKFYTVMTIDPDAPNHTPGNFYLHMIKSNIEGNSILKGNISSGVDVQSYVGPGPPKNTGDHRYVFLIYEQKSGDLKLEAPEVRARFNISEWGKDLPLCGPLAGVQFRARNEL